MHYLVSIASIALLLSGFVCPQEITNSFPHEYPGMPKGDFSPEWQDYFLVKDPLPNVTFPMSRNWAGNIPVNRTNHPNDTLFFWAFEHINGSLTTRAGENSSEPWAIWINGGPGASSMLGLLLENGPLHVTESGGMVGNNASWDKLVDYIWVDQPVGVGFSTAESSGGYIRDEDQMADDFVNFLSNLVKVFPSLSRRPLIFTGESYAGTYIPYITKAIFSTPNPPVKLSKIAMGNAAIGTVEESEVIPMLSIIETFPQLIGYDPEVYQYFKEQTHLCGFDFNLTYPQTSKLPPIVFPDSGDEAHTLELRSRAPALIRHNLRAIARGVESPKTGIVRREHLPTREEVTEREERRQAWVREKRSVMALAKRDLTGRVNGTIDPQYECFLNSMLEDYAFNFSLPWNLSRNDEFPGFNHYNIPDARSPDPALDPFDFMNDNRTRSALHAPTSKNWTLSISYPFNSSLTNGPGSNPFGDPSVPPILFFDEWATNATRQNVSIVIYSGNDDSVVPHFSSQISIQNTTFGGIQGFTQKPSTPFTDDDGNFIGIVHQERNWTYALIANAGHEVPEYAPNTALVFFREFILGNNKTGLVSGPAPSNAIASATILFGNILRANSAILYGSGTATSLYVAPAETIASWDAFFVTARTAPASAFSDSTPTSTSTSPSSASSSIASNPSSTSTDTSGGLHARGVYPGFAIVFQVVTMSILGCLVL